MKLIFFLIAFCLIFIRMYFSWTGHDHGNGNEGNMTISSDNFIEQMKWSGQIKFNEDESAIQSISAGGYLKYRKNDVKVVAESNLHGEISYELYDGHNKLNMDDRGKKLVSEAIKEMIAYGFDAEGRMDRIYKKGGKAALLNELDNIKFDNVKGIYLDRLLSTDSNSQEDLTLIAKKIDSMGSDIEKSKYFSRFSIKELEDSQTNRVFYGGVQHMNSDLDKGNILMHLIQQGSLTDINFDHVLDLIKHFNSDLDKLNLTKELIKRDDVTEVRLDNVLGMVSNFNSDLDKQDLLRQLMDRGDITGKHVDKLLDLVSHFGSDLDKENVLHQLMDKKEVDSTHFDQLIDIISRFGSDLDRENMYKKFFEVNGLTEVQWTHLLNNVALINADIDKSNLLVEIAGKMPKTDNLKSVYLRVAKTIGSDPDFGKAIRAIE